MPVVKTMGHFNYIECDSQNCNRKIENPRLTELFKVADMVGWKGTQGDDEVTHWLCPRCGTAQSAKEVKQLPKRTKSRAVPKPKRASTRAL